MPFSSAHRRLSLQYRLLTWFVLLVAGVVAAVTLLVGIRQRHVTESLTEEKGLAIAHSLVAASSNALLSYNYVTLQQLTERASREDGVQYVIILDKEGTVAGYSNHADWQGRRLQDPINESARATDEALVQTVADRSWGYDRGLDIAVPVFVEGSSRKWGVVRVGLSLNALHAEIARTREWLLIFGLGVLLLAGLAARFLAQRITMPIHRLVEATGELAKGNFNYRSDIHTGDEIEDLSRKFDAMASEIRARQVEVQRVNGDLARLNANLESMVQERTNALVEAEEKYRLLVEQSPNPICIIQDGKLMFFNNVFPETFGYTAEELTSPDFEIKDLIEPEQREDLEKFCARVVEEGEPENLPFELTARRRDGSRIYLDMRSTTIGYQGGKALEVILVDMTEQRNLQEQVVSYERLRALGEMASGVAHDFNNVLGAILARAQFLQKKDLSPEVARGLRIIEKAAQDGGETVKRIQEFTRVRTERDFTAINMNKVLEDVIEITRGRWEDEGQRQGKNIRIVRRFTEIPEIQGNISELREAFTNLIFNATDAISNRGTISISTHQEGEIVVVMVQDDGAGMPEEVQGHLFDPFFTTKGPQGNGLGMSIVYGIIRRHGGDIDVVSEPGEGTLFRLSFPVATAQRSVKEEPFEEAPILAGSGRILVVDDDEDIRELVADILTDAGYDVTTASDGAVALVKVESDSFDLVVTDLGMPGVSGWDVAQGSRAAQPDIRLVLLTGWGATLDPAEVERCGIDRTLKKPFEMDELLRVVQELLRVGSTRRVA